jgi:hypothetical protein
MTKGHPCPPPLWEDEEAVIGYVLLELSHGHDQPTQRDLTDREADWQVAGACAAEREAGRP